MKKGCSRGFTLAELLVTVAILAVIAGVAVPLLSSQDTTKLNVAAEEAANLLRFALSEAQRTGGYVLVDGKSSAGQLRLYKSNANAQVPPTAGTALINDPLTKRPAILDVSGSPFSQGVNLTPQFRASGSAWTQLLIGPGLSQLQGFDGPASGQGALQANSGVQLSYAGRSVTVGIHEITGRVTLP